MASLSKERKELSNWVYERENYVPRSTREKINSGYEVKLAEDEPEWKKKAVQEYKDRVRVTINDANGNPVGTVGYEALKAIKQNTRSSISGYTPKNDEEKRVFKYLKGQQNVQARKSYKAKKELGLITESKVLDEPKKEESAGRDANFWDLTINSVKKGYTQSLYGQETYKAMTGQANNKAFYEEKLKSEDYSFIPNGIVEEWVSGAMELLGQQFKQWTDPRSLTAATAGAGSLAATAAIAGQAGPQIAVPEELLTVPAAAITGFITGIQAGSTMANFEIEAGHAYNEMIENGISHETARNIALGVGAGNAALEMIQLDELVKGFKAIKHLNNAEGFLKKLGAYLATKGVSVAKETLQEVGQEGVTMTGVNIAGHVEDKGTIIDWKDFGKRLGDTAVSSAMSFAMLGAGGDVINYSVNKTANAIANRKKNTDVTATATTIQANDDTPDDDSATQTDSAPASPVQNVVENNVPAQNATDINKTVDNTTAAPVNVAEALQSVPPAVSTPVVAKAAPAVNNTNDFADELSEVASAGAVATYAPNSASADVVSLENKLISVGASDIDRQKVVETAIAVESTLVGTDKSLKDALADTTNITGSAVTAFKQSVGAPKNYWSLFNTNLKTIAALQTNENLIVDYANAFAEALQSRDSAMSKVVTDGGIDAASVVSQYALTGSVPEEVKNKTVLSRLSKAFTAITDPVLNQIDTAHIAIYGDARTQEPTPEMPAETQTATTVAQPATTNELQLKKADKSKQAFNPSEVKTIVKGSGIPRVFEMDGSKYVTEGHFALRTDDAGIAQLNGTVIPYRSMPDGMQTIPADAVKKLLDSSYSVDVGELTPYTPESEKDAKTPPYYVFVADGIAHQYSKKFVDALKKRSTAMKLTSGGALNSTLIVGYDADGNITGFVLPVYANGNSFVDKDGNKIPFATKDNLKALVKESKDVSATAALSVTEDAESGIKSDKTETKTPESVIKKADSVTETPESEKITVGMSDDARAELLNKKSVNVVSVDAEHTKALDNVDLDALQNSYPSYARPIIKKIARDFGILNEPFFNPDIELEFSYSGDSIQESINKQHSRYGDFVKMLSVFSDVIENAVGVETHKDKYTGTRREDTNLKQMYVLASAFSDEKGVYPVKLEVKEFKKNTNKLYLSVVLTKKESRYLSGNLGQDQLNTAPPTSTISISDLVGIVNPSEGDFLKYFPDSMLDSEQIEGKNKALAKDAEKIEKLSEDKKRSLATAENANALSSTPETTNSTDSADTVSQESDSVNSSVRTDVENDTKAAKSKSGIRSSRDAGRKALKASKDNAIMGKEKSVEAAPVEEAPEDAQKYNIVVSNLKRKAEELGLLDSKFFTALQNVNLYKPSASDRALISSEFRRVFAGNTEPLVTNWLNSISEDAQPVTSTEPQNDSATAEVDSSDVEVAVVVDAINETLVPGAKGNLLKALDEAGRRADVITLAKSLRKAYKNVGTLGKMAEFFADNGKKVISAIESTIHTENVAATDTQRVTKVNEENVQVADKSHTVAYTNDNEKIDLKFKIVSVDNIIASNELDGRVNPDYPQELQPRDRSRDASQIQITQMANNLNPARLAESTSVSEGAPIVGADNVVESGNGRTLAIKLAYETGTADAYKSYIISNAGNFGIDTSNLPAKPILVRERLTEVDRIEFTRKANESSVGSLSATEQAKVDAENLTNDILNLLIANDNGIINTSENKNFISAVITKVFKNEDLNNVVGADGMLSARGLERIKNAIFYKAYGDASLSARLSESLDNDMKNATNVLLNIAPKVVYIKNGIASGNLYDFDFSSDIAGAVRLFEKCRNTNTTVNNYAAQTTMFEKESPLVMTFAHIFETKNRGAKQATDLYNSLLDRVINLGNPNQVSLGITEVFETKGVLFDAVQKQYNTGVEATKQITIPENIYRPESITGRDDDRRGIVEVSGFKSTGSQESGNAMGIQRNNRPSKETGTIADDEQLRQAKEGVEGQPEVDKVEQKKKTEKKSKTSTEPSKTEVAEEVDYYKGKQDKIRTSNSREDDNKNLRYSLNNEYWHTDLTNKQVKEVEKWIRKAGNPEETRITDTANWYKGRINGDNLFVIYSTEDINNPTILYEVKGKNAKAELDTLQRILEVIENGESVVGKQGDIDRLLSGNWVQKKHDMADNYDRLGEGRSDTGYASVLQRESSKFIGSQAFRNVIENLFEIQDGIDSDWSMPITDSMKDSVLYEGQPLYSLEREGKNNGEVRKDLLSGNGRRGHYEGSGKQVRSLSEAKFKTSPKTEAERKSITKAIPASKIKKEIKGNTLINIIDESAYTDDMKELVLVGKQDGYSVHLFTGTGYQRLDAQRLRPTDGVIIGNDMYLQYDGASAPQQLYMHEDLHGLIAKGDEQTLALCDEVSKSISPEEKESILKQDRYVNYMEIYNDGDIVWEEFLVSTINGENDYSAEFFEAISAYVGNELIDNYKVSEYNRLIDTGSSNASVLENIGLGNDYRLSESDGNNGAFVQGSLVNEYKNELTNYEWKLYFDKVNQFDWDADTRNRKFDFVTVIGSKLVKSHYNKSRPQVYAVEHLTDSQEINSLLEGGFIYDEETRRILETIAGSAEQNNKGTADTDIRGDRGQGSIGSGVSANTEKIGQPSRYNDSVDTIHQPISQGFKSAGTSLNQVAALFKNKHFHPGKINIDIGGGKFDATSNFLRSLGTENYVFDPFNRTEQENTATLDFLMSGKKADTATCANVLNVIDTEAARLNVILETAKAIKADGTAYFTVYTSDNSGVGRQTQADSWQNARKTEDYVSEIETYFNNVERKGNIIIATEPKANLPQASWEVKPGKAFRYDLSTYDSDSESLTTERKSFARQLIEQGQTEEVIDGTDKYTLVKPEAYNDDMLSMVEEARSKGLEVGFFVGNAKIKFDTKDEFKVDGIKVSGSRVLVQYDGIRTPQSILKHEGVHSKWNTPEMQKVKDTILDSLSKTDKESILSQDRYKRYKKIYKGNMDNVWEEFVCDVMSGMNEYTSAFIDTVADYWYGDESIDRYSPADYTNSIDAGGRTANNLTRDGVSDGQTGHNRKGIDRISERVGDQGRRDSSDPENLSDGNSKRSVQSTGRKVDREKRGAAQGSSMESVEVVTPTTNTEETPGGDRTNGERFLVALRNGDEETARTLLNGQAVKNGFVPASMYHGTQSDNVFTQFNTETGIHWVTPNLDYADGYSEGYYGDDVKAEQLFTEPDSGIYDLYIKPEKVLDVGDTNANISTLNDIYDFGKRIRFSDEEILRCWNEGRKHEDFHNVWTMVHTSAFANIAREHGYDTISATEKDGVQTYGCLYLENLKSAKLETFDDNGNLIPLEERFNSDVSDIRFSLEGDDIPDFLELWDEYIDKYGTIPKGENPTRDIDVPKKITKDKLVSQFARTMLEAGVTPDNAVSEFEKRVLDGTMTHEVVTNNSAREWAVNQIKYHGFEEALNTWSVYTRDGNVGKKELALGLVLYNQCITNGDVANAMKIAAELVAEATHAAQTLQATRMLKLMTPDGQLYYLEKSIQKMNDEFKKKIGDRYEDIELNEDLMEKFLTEKDADKRDEIYDNICQDIADQIPATLLDKWNSWRYLAMLGNARTHIRNIAGNAVFVPAIKLKNYIGAAIETAAKVDAEKRTKSLRKNKDAVDFAKKDFRKMQKVLQGENAKYAVTSDIEGKRTIFKTKWLESLRNKNFEWLEKEDMWFLEKHYVDALAQIITARKLDVNNIDEKTLDIARAYAVREAQRATYRDANSLAEALNKLQKKAEHSDKKAIRATNLLIEGVMPFKKTPLNIAKQGVQYSPIGILSGIYKIADKVKGGKAYSTTDIIDDFAKGLTGTAIMLLGTLLASLGIISGGADDNKKKKEFDKMVGEQAFSLNIGDSSYTIDWMTPACLPLFTGVELYELTKDDFKFADIVTALSSLTDPLLELSVFSGISGAIESAQYNDTNTLYAIGSDMTTSYLTQALPTIGGQLSRIIDKNKREYYYTDKNSNLPKGLQNIMGQAASKIPFASYLFEPAIDEWGREETYGSLFERAVENAVSPGYYAEKNYTAVDNEIKRLYESTGDASVLPVIQQKKYTEAKVDYPMTAEQYTEAKRIRGQKSFALINNLIKSNKYKSMSDVEKAAAIAKCYREAGEYTKEQMINKVKRNK